MKHSISGCIAFVLGIAADRLLVTKQYESGIKNEKLQRDKLQEFYDLLLSWLELKQRGSTLWKYFEKHQYQSVAIYGMKELGQALSKELDCPGINVKYLIDRNADAIYSDREVYLPEDELPEVDVIVVTALHYYEEIKRGLSVKVQCPVVNLADVVHEALVCAVEEESLCGRVPS